MSDPTSKRVRRQPCRRWPRLAALAVRWQAALITLTLCWAGGASAFSLTPMEMRFATSGSGTTRLFRIDNPGTTPAAIELSTKSRRLTLDGADELSDADDDFAIYPRQLVLRPGQAQTVRVQWLGKAVPPHELSYRLIAEQLPIDPLRSDGAADDGSPRLAVRVLLKYIASLYVAPPGARPRLGTVDLEAITLPGGPGLRVTVQNAGTAHVLLEEPRLTLQADDGTRHVLRAQELGSMAGANVLAHGKRRFDILLPTRLAAWGSRAAPAPLRPILEGSWNDSPAPRP